MQRSGRGLETDEEKSKDDGAEKDEKDGGEDEENERKKHFDRGLVRPAFSILTAALAQAWCQRRRLEKVSTKSGELKG